MFTWFAAIVSAFAWSRTEVFFLERYWNTSAVAMFAVGITLSSVATRGPMLFGSPLLPHFAEHGGAGDRGAISRTYASGTRLMAFVIFPSSLGLAALTPTLLPLLFGNSFLPAVPSAMVLAGFSLVAVTSVGSALLYGLERAYFIAWGGALGALSSLLASILVIPRWGPWGAAWSRSAVQVAMVVLGAWYIHSRLSCPVPLRALGRILCAALLSGSCAFLAARWIPGVPGVVIGVPSGAVAYLGAVRMLHALPAQDLAPLRRVLERLPWPVSSILGRAAAWVVAA